MIITFGGGAVGRRGADEAPSGTPAYIAALSDFDAVQLTGASAPANETIVSVTPAEWQDANKPPGTVDLAAVITAWSGGSKGSGTKLLINGGGHQDSANNGAYIYDFDGDTPNGYESPLIVSAVSAVQEGDTYTDGRWAAAHTYDGLVHVNGTVYRFGGAPWSAAGGFTAAAFKFITSTGVNTQLTDYPGASGAAVTFYDPVTGNIFVTQEAFLGYFFRPGAETWSAQKTYSPTPAPGDDASGAYDHTRGQGIILGEDNGSPSNRLLTLDFAAETASMTTFTPSGDTTILNETGVSVVFDETADCYWIFGGAAASHTTIYRMDAATFAITAHLLSATIDGLAGTNGSFGRYVLMEAHRAIGFVARHDEAPWVIKLPSS